MGSGASKDEGPTPSQQKSTGTQPTAGKRSASGKDAVLVTVKIGDIKYNGTDNAVMIKFTDSTGKSTRDIQLDNVLKNDFKKGTTDSFSISDISEDIDGELGEIAVLEIWRKQGLSDDGLYLETLVAERSKTKTEKIFPIHRWIPMRKQKRLLLSVFDSSLPQDDAFNARRRKELTWKRAAYFAVEKYPGIPKSVSELPQEEEFTSDYNGIITKQAIKAILTSGLKRLFTADPRTIDDFKSYYTSKTLPLPQAAKEDWFMRDDYFGEQRLTGCNPMQIELCTAIPGKFPVTDDMVGQFLEGKTLNDAINEKRLFILDYELIDDLEVPDEDLSPVSPLALLYRNTNDELMPVAIQLQQKPCDENPIFLPSDPKYTWLMAKTWCNTADANVHQSKCHLGFTHLFSESICAVTHMQLSPSHPVFKLLAPHFLFLLAINSVAMRTLVSPGGFFDKFSQFGRLGSYSIISRSKKIWKMNVDGNPAKDTEMRGVGKDVLPYYPYRDDAIALFDAIRDYASEIIQGVYTDGNKLAEDYEIKSWYKFISSSVEDGGLGYEGVPGDGKTPTVEDIIDIVTTTIYISSVGHAAVNFNQYDQYAFPLVYPFFLRGKPPSSKDKLQECDVLDALPDTASTLEIMAISSLLSLRATQSLGDFEVQYAFDDLAVSALEKFRQKLLQVGNQCVSNNSSRHKYPYDILDPKYIPNAISI